ncbi:hypothetical protein POX_e06164 [Penicillium oxalicum]|uniref:hypothetical protein n=1 Tax=Penicillium oxalicum TaxID=69781 RepID=UPI0020B75FC7|nr:hypothetical protein POX_e06164 [Penicillium oxalicum]KAI2788152.1 hypothetical protein POX_e06164 [Penicillium oxalicum]
MTLSNGAAPPPKENPNPDVVLSGERAGTNDHRSESALRLEGSHWANIDHAAVELFDHALTSSSDGLVSLADYVHYFKIPGVNHSAHQASIISAAWAIVMSEYTNSNDVLFGQLKGGKNSPLRVLLKQDDTIESLLRRVEESRTITQVTVAASRRKVQCVLAFYGHEEMEAGPYPGPLKDEVLQVSFILHASLVNIKVLYNELSVERSKIERLFQQLGHVLTQLYENPTETALGKVSSVTAKDINDMKEWNMRSHKSYVLDSINATFERQVMASPDSWAINAWDGSLTYAQLYNQAKLLANSLYEAGVRPHDLVPLAFDKSVWFTISVLAVLKVGAAIVPLDPDWPRERRMYIVEDAGSRLALTNVARFKEEHPGLTVIDVSKMIWAPQTEPKINFAHIVTPAHAAYAFFTSGTTGRPKGCIIEHGAFVASALERAKVLVRDESSRVLQVATHTFDPAMEDILTTLLVGGCVCVPNKQEYLNDLRGSICKCNANTLNIAPSLIRSLRPEQVPSLKTLILGGEKMSDRVLETWTGAVSLFNAYGPTECCIKSTINIMSAGADPRNIGYPAGCSIWLTRPYDQDTLAAIGTVGEILIQGPNLAREYLNRPELTAQSFPRNLRWASQAGLGSDTRFYKTGDLARFNPDGSICLLGRRDSQVKIHGQRIELGEIDHHLRQSFPAETEAIAGVVTFKDRETSCLVAFVQMMDQRSSQANPGSDLALLDDPSQVQQLQTSAIERLSKVLPAYMIPLVFLPVQNFLYFSNGKTNRKGMCEQAADMSLGTILKKFGRVGHETHDDSSWSADALALRQLWATALCLDAKMIAVDDTFSSLGGDSLAAIELARLCRAHNVDLTVDDILQCPTILTQLENKQVRQVNNGTNQIAPFALLEMGTDIGKLREEVSKPCQVDAATIEDIYPVSPMQESLMALSMDISPYISQFVFRIDRNVKLNDLRAAWKIAAQDIPILRTRIVHTSEHGTVQVVINEEIEWSNLENIEIAHFLLKDKGDSMHLGDRLNRFTVVREEEGPSFLVWTCHHACHDGRTVDQVLEYVNSLRSGGSMRSFAPFKQFIEFQKNLSLSDWETYWKRRLADAPVSSFPGGDSGVRQPLTDSLYRHYFKLPRRNVKDSLTSSSSSATVIRAAWALLVARYEGSNCATFGTIVGGSSSLVPNSDAIVGPTNNTIPMNISVPEEWSVQKFLSHVREHFESSPFQHVGLAQLGELSPSIRDITRVRNLLVLQRPYGHSGDQLGLERIQVSAHANFKYPLVVECTLEVENGLSVAFMFDSHILDEVQVSRLAVQFERLIQALNTDFKIPLTNIDVLGPSDMAQIQKWQIEVPPSGSFSLPHYILENALERPDAPALCSWDGNLTYAQLQNLSSRLSSHLIQAGVRRGDNVLCHFEKSACAIVCMLAVLKCGAASIPLGLSWPRTRLEAVSSVVKAKFVLSSPKPSGGTVGLAMHHLEITMSLIQRLPDIRDYGVDASLPSDTAFIMFTSGSTGSPKGIPLCHEQLVANLNTIVQHMRYTPQSRTYQFSDFVFDLSLSDIFGTFMAGGCLCMPSEQERQQSLADSMNRMRINVVGLTPTVAKLLTLSDVPTLRFMLLGGEGLSKDDLERWAGHVDVINAYGMTESCIVSTSTDVRRPDSDPRNIGRAINCLAWITDANHPHRLAPIGTVGELVVQGPGVASGYLNRPDESKRVFLDTLPWSFDRNRAYRTGDLVKYDADGSIIYIGRKDAQLKVRGQRFEAGEVEAQLKDCGLPGGFCVDIVKVVSPDDPEVSVPILALFISLEDGSAVMASSEPAIARHAYQDTSTATNVLQTLQKLKSRLPDYMHPQAVVPISQMPVSGTGKLDRKVLRALVADVSYAELLGFSPQPDKGAASERKTLDSEAQRTIAMLWSQVLPVGESHVFHGGDDFFQLGGHSITLMRLTSLAKKHGVLINFAEAFLRPTLAAMAECAHSGWSQDKIVHPKIPPFSMTGSQTESILQEAAITCRLDPAEIVDIYPSTPLQEGLMTLSLSKPGLYTAQFAWSLPESLDLNLFEAAWESLAKLNALLRTRLIYSTGYWQVVSKNMRPWTTAQSSLHSYIEHEKAHSMGLGEPLSRMAIVRDTVSATTYFVWTCHHSLYDGHSMQAIQEWISAFYLKARELPIVPFKIFVDHISKNTQSEASLNFWKETLNDCPKPSFPALPSNDYQQSAGVILKVEASLPQEQRRDVTLASAIQAAWAILLAKYEGSEDVLFGMTLGGRSTDMPEIEKVMGPTLCTVPVRLRPSPDRDVTSFLKAVQELYLHSALHGQTGLARISKLSADADSVLKIRSLLIIHEPLSTELQGLEKLGCIRVKTDVKDFVSYALVIECIPVPASNRLKLKISYDKGVLRDTDAHHLALQIEFVLQQLLGEACNKLKDICTVSPIDMQTLANWNRELPKPVESTIQDLFANQAARQPDSPAICSWDGEMTYKELDSHTTRLARQIVSCGVGEGDLVPICFRKSMWTVVAMLAVLKAGGGCVCLDPNHPSDYHQGILSRIGAKLIIIGSGQLSMFKQIPTIGVDAVSVNNMADSSAKLPPVKPSQVAFVVFTSGTTGQPKGILLEHLALCTSILAHGRFMRFGPRSRVLQFASYTFDVSIADIFTTLVFGGCVCVPSDHDRMNNLSGAMNALKVNHAYLTSSVAAMLDPDGLQNPLNVLAVGGEQVGHDVLQTWATRTNLINMYGPAETTIWCGGKDSVGFSDSPLDIGRGVGARMWLTDPNDPQQLAPIGAVGEILVEGPLLARGYLDDPSRTSAAFADMPRWAKSLNSIDGFESITGRLYRSGDLGKYQPDGSILIFGRRDTQLKIRGQRVELSEIENQLHSIIQDHRCVVDVYTTPDGQPSLVAFIGLGSNVQDGEKAKSMACIASDCEIPTGLANLVDGLQSRLAKVLPPYMVPAQYLVLREMPLLVSGKTDRKTLRRLASSHFREAPKQAAPMAAQQKQIPVTDMEWNLFSLWTQVLGISNLGSLGTDDNFFRCGGDSLKAMRMVSLAAQRGVQVKVADVFKHPVMADLAKALTKDACTNEEPARTSVLDALEPFAMLDESARDEITEQASKDCDIPVTRIEDIYPCTQLQNGLFALSQKQPGTYVAQFGFLVGKSLSIPRLREAWDTVCRQTPVLRSRLWSTPSGLLQVVLDEDFTWFDRSDVDTTAELSQDKAAVGGSGRPFQRFRVCHDATTGDTKLFWTIHHSAYDGWSLQRVLEYVQLAYRDQLKPLASTSFSRFVQYANSIVESDEARGFWKRRLANAPSPTFPALPETNYRPVADSIVSMEVGNVKTPAFVTLATLLRAAWAMVVGAYETSYDVVFMSTVSGRSAPLKGIETVMGPTIATIPVRVDFSDRKKNVAELLQVLQDAAAEEIAFQQVGLQSIRRISGDCEKSCNARNLLVIQTDDVSQKGVTLEDFEKLPENSRDFSTFPFTLECSIKEKNQVFVEATFDSRVINFTQVHRILRLFQHVTLQLCQTDAALCDIEVISPSDLNEIRSWNPTMPAAKEACIHHELERLARLHPDREAICSWDGSLTFRELDSLSERYAGYLQSQGVKVESFVPICFDKSKWAIVAMVAIMKAGGAWAPIDPRHPQERRDGVFSALSSSLVVTSAMHAQLFSIHTSLALSVHILDETALEKIPRSLSLNKPVVLPSNAVFLVFTSGSTGVPKAIVDEHRGICTGAHALGGLIGFGPKTRFWQFAAYTFDQSFGDIFHVLLRGGCVCIPSESDRQNDLAGSICRLRANTTILTPTVACSINPADLGSHRMESMVLGGEPMTVETIRTWAPNSQMYHTYGPTECSVISIGRTFGMQNISLPGNIGQGLGALIWLTDPSDPDRLAPIGAVGEILIEGPLLSRGYLNNPELTNAAYIRDPKWSRSLHVPGATGSRRFYRTGDLGQYDTDGTIICLGRRDGQVKLRGQRVELGEIEHHISIYAKSQVTVAADVHTWPGGASMLVACISLDSIKDRDGDCRLVKKVDHLEKFVSALSGVDEYLSRVLPSHMVPTLFIPCTQIPRTISGKKDHLGNIWDGGESGNDRPMNDREERLCRLWLQVLKLDLESNQIKQSNNFFSSGGDSVRAMSLVAAARREGIHLTVADIFNHPKLYDMAAAMDLSSPKAKPVNVASFSLLPPGAAEKAVSEASTACQIELSQIEDIYPATPLQQGLVMLSIRDSGAYVSRFVFRLPDDIDLDRLQRAWEQVYLESPALRTRIIDSSLPSQLLQVVISQNVKWHYAENMETYVGNKGLSDFGLGDSLMEVCIIQQAHGAKSFALTLHHAIYDGWSLQRLLAATEQIYFGKSALPFAPFKNFVHHLSQADTAAASGFWRSYLSGAPVTSLFIEQGASFKPFADKVISHTLKIGTRRRSQPGETLSSVLRAAWALILSSYKGDTALDVVFGVVVGGRSIDLADIENIDGPTIATIPFRVKYDEQTAVTSLVQHVQNISSQLIEHEHLGLQSIKKLSDSARNACDFQTVLVVQNPLDSSAETGFLDLKNTETRPDMPPTIPLVVECIISDGNIEILFHFDDRLLDGFQAERMIKQLAHVVEQLINGDANQTIAAIQIASPSDILDIKRWNSFVPPRVDSCLHDLVLQKARDTPDQIAIHSSDAVLDYRTLDRLSGFLAHHLQTHQVGPEVKVPFCMEKSASAIVSILAVLRSGGASVPLDMTAPKARNREIISRVNSGLVLVTPSTRSLFDGVGYTLLEVTMSMLGELAMSSSPENAPSTVSPTDAAYVLFTSGSTGLPKGVVVEHRAIATSVSSFASYLGVTPDTRLLQFAPYVFDVSIGEMFASLVSGACLCIASEAQMINDLGHCIREMKVDFAVLTPTFAETITPEAVPGLQTLVLGGEPVRKQNVETWGSAVKLINGYGPTEASVLSLAHRIPDAQSPVGLIGRPVGCRGWIASQTDPNALCPVGVVGELLIEGHTLARGYLDTPSANEAFIAEPAFLASLAPQKSATRVYRTGDLVRYTANGIIQFIGRKDTQIKFHGRRIEVSEIEHAAIKVMQDVRHLAVELVHPGGTQQQALALFFQPPDVNGTEEQALILAVGDEARENMLQLKSQLAEMLPPYMVPSLFVPLTSWPRTANGKLHRRLIREAVAGLCPEDIARHSLHIIETALPATDREKQLAATWAATLHVDQQTINRNDSFLQHGGDSVAAVRLVTLARKNGFNLSVETVLSAPILREMALRMEYVETITELAVEPFSLIANPEEEIIQASVQCGVDPAAVEDIYPCSSMQSSLIALTAKNSTAYISQFVLAIPENRDIQTVQNAWNTVVKDTPVLRTRFFHPSANNSIQNPILQAVIRVEPIWTTATQLHLFLQKDKQTPMTIGTPYTRFAIVDDQVKLVRYLVFSAHHAVYDGWSLGLTIERVAQALDGTPISPAAGYNTFIQHIQSHNWENTKAFWIANLDGASPTTFPPLPSHAYEPVTDDHLTHRFNSPARSSRYSNVTTATVLRSAWSMLVSRYCDSQDVVFGVTVNGRMAPIPGIERVQGPTLTTIPFRAIIDPAQSAISFLEQVQARSLQSIPHEQYGLQNIKSLSDLLSELCKFQSLLVIQSPRETTSDHHGTRMSMAPGEDLGSAGIRGFHNLALVVECTTYPNFVEVNVSFDSNILPRPQVQRLAQHLQHLYLQLQATADDPSVRLADISHVSPSDLAEMLEWNKSVPESYQACVHELFEKRARMQPDAPAICARDGELTYSELDQKATILATYLRQQGLSPGVLVPLLFEKSCWTIVTMLAVLKSGAANVALNPEHPQARLQGLIDVTESHNILCSRKNFEIAIEFDRQVIVVDEELFSSLGILEEPSTSLSPKIHTACPDDPAFILFTSGTTGKPKGIVINHAAFCSSIRGHSSTLRFSTGPGSRNFQFTAYTSDVSIGEIFTSLAVGSCVCVPSDYDRVNNLAGSIRDLGVNWAFLTPSVAALLTPKEVPGLRTLLFGGETATTENICTWADSLYLINSAGPAECSIWTHCNPGISTADIGSNWGYNLGCATWITNPNNPGELMPIGVVGEMLIEGPNLAQGYLKDPERSEKTFANVYLAGKKRRLYRTGDLARFMADGKTQFLGRKDTQVKLRGQRVEIGEIENQIRRHVPESILVAVEMVRISKGKSAPLLAAFISRKDSLAADVVALAVKESGSINKMLANIDQKLGEFLPRHMVPTVFIPLSRMPLTASAKTDRNVLAAVAATISAEQLSNYALGAADKQPPSTAAEHQMVQLWKKALSIDMELGIHDSFFRIGGDSIGAMRLVSIARSAGVFLTVEQIFRNPTLQQMASIMTTTTQLPKVTNVKPFSLISSSTSVDTVRAEAQEQCQVGPQQIQDVYPCSALQEGLFALSLKTSGSYLAQMVFSLPDGFHDDKFKEAWTQAAREAAPTLRTRFFESPSHNHRMMQTVVDAPLSWASSESLDGYLAADAASIVQLGAPTSRFAFVTDAQKGRFFIFTAHHAIYDGASLPPLFDAVRKAFDGDAIPRTSSYNVFIQYLLGMDQERSRDFWRTSLEGSPAPTFPRLPSMGYRAQTNDSLKHSVSLPIRHDTEFTASSMIRAAWSLVTAAHSDSDDVVFASTISGRTLPIASIESIIGPTLATVPVRATVDRSMSVIDFLTALQEQATEMLPHEQYGMQNIRRISPSISASCDLHNLLVINASTSEASNSGGLGLTQVNLGHLDGFHNFALSLECAMHDGMASLTVSFDNHVIDPRQMRRLVLQFENILGQLSTCGAHTKIEDLVLVSPEESAEINHWNDSVPPPQYTCVHTVVEHRVQSQPHAPAVCSWEGQLTYEELDELSSALANQLIHNWDVTPGTLVPLMFEKSIWTIVTMFAVLKAGGANVPLDPEQPVARLSELVADVGATFALSSVKYQEKAVHIAQRALVVDPNEIRMMRTGPVTHKATGPCPTDPAFILFTSGSTGKPKGIVIDHMAFSSSMKGHGEVLRYEKGRRNLQFTAYTSDVSIGEIFTSLSAGACVCVPSDFERMNDLAGAIDRMQVDWAFLTPSMASLLDADKVPTLKTLLFGGETATPENIATWASRLFLINSFGPAECSIWTHADPGVSEKHNGSHIGYAIGCATWIVDPSDYRKLVPIGSVGELVVEGPNVARGYLNNEEKTKAAFLETAPWLPAGRKNRLYKMGDLVRYLPDGKIQFLGRKDGQVKLHGQRIEIGEIEHQVRVVLGNVEISVAVEMVSLGSESSQPFLAIFLDYENQKSDDVAAALSTGDESKQWVRETINTIVGHLRDTLPRHMVPTVVFPLTRMPLNASAKTDRKALKQIASGVDVTQLPLYALASTESASITPPSTQNEQILHRIWADTLSVPADRFGTEANFMALGGDSIAAMKVIPLARAAGLVISVADILSHPVLRDMAQISRSSNSESDYVAPFSLLAYDIDRNEILAQSTLYSGLQPEAIEDIYPCTPVQKEFITTTQSQPGAYTLQDVYKLPSTVDLTRLQRACGDTVAAHAVLRTRIFPYHAQMEHLQVVQKASPDFELTRGGDLQRYLKEDKANGMGYGEPLARFALVSEGEDAYMVFTYHHSIYDAASLQIIMNDLQAFYMDESYQVGEPPYNIFVRHLLQLSSQDAPSQFWTEHLAGNGQSITPLLGPKSGEQWTPRVDTLVHHFIDFPMPYRHSRLSLTTAALTYAALSLVVARLTNSTSAVFELTLLGRNEPVPGIERMVGTTTTSAPLRIDITGDNEKGADRAWTLTLADYLSYVQQRVNGITRYEHTGMATIRTLCSDAQPILEAALPIVVHPSNPHKEALGSGIGLERREIRSMGQSTSAFYMDVSAVEGEALEINLPFDSRVVGREKVGRMLGLLEMVVVEIMTLSARGQLGNVSLSQLDWDSACLSEPEMQDYYG